MKIQKFTFNPFSENTYVLYEDGEAVVVDPGMNSKVEQKEFDTFMDAHQLTLKRCILTHAHIDHILGNQYIKDTYQLLPELHKADVITLENNERVAAMYGIPYVVSPNPAVFLDENDAIMVGKTKLEIRFVPGHAPGHIVFIDHESKAVIAGDTLFRMSIGRTDLPGGNHEQLLAAIRAQLFSLDDDYTVYCGHGPETSIGFEKRNNPFLK